MVDIINNANLILFFAALLCAAAALFRAMTAPETRIEPKENRGKRLWLLGFAMVAVLIRVWKFGMVPGGFNQDGAMAAVDALALAEHGTDRFGMRYPVHLTAWGYGQMSALLSYLMIPFIKLLGFSALAVRLPQLLISLLGLWAMYAFSRAVFGKPAGLAVLGFGAVCPWHILQSRWVLDCNLYPHFFIFGLYFLNKALASERKRIWLCLSMIMLGLCMYCYGVAIYTMPVFLILSCGYLLWRKRVSLFEALLCAAVWLGVAWPFILTMAINFFGWETIETPFFTLPYFPDSMRANDILFFSDDFFAQLKVNARALLEATIKQGRDLPWNNIPDFGSLYLFSVPFLLPGLYRLCIEAKKKDGAALLLFMLLTGIWCGLCTNSVNINRVNIIFIPMMILAALGIYELWRAFDMLPVKLGIMGAYILAFALFCATYFGSYAESMEYYFMADFGRAVSSVKDSEADKVYITTRSQSENSANVSEILSLFYHELDAEYFQGKACPEGLLPYEERYTYLNFERVQPEPGEDAVYVLRDDELQYLEVEEYEMKSHGRYYVLRALGG